MNKEHPELTYRMHSLLWSINERLGGKDGIEVPPLDYNWIDDLFELNVIEYEEMMEAEQEAKGKFGGGHSAPQTMKGY